MSDEARAAALLAANLHEADLEHSDECDDFRCTCHPWRVAVNALLKIIEEQASRPVTDAEIEAIVSAYDEEATCTTFPCKDGIAAAREAARKVREGK
jgi:hypothetical protein